MQQTTIENLRGSDQQIAMLQAVDDICTNASAICADYIRRPGAFMHATRWNGDGLGIELADEIELVLDVALNGHVSAARVQPFPSNGNDAIELNAEQIRSVHKAFQPVCTMHAIDMELVEFRLELSEQTE